MVAETLTVREPVAGLRRLAERLGATPDEAAALFLEEPYHSRARYPHIVFHDFAVGRQAHVVGTGLRVWELVKASRAFDGKAVATAEYFEIDPSLVEEALEYARLHPEEVEAAIRNHESFDRDRFSQLYPHLETFQAPNETEQP